MRLHLFVFTVLVLCFMGLAAGSARAQYPGFDDPGTSSSASGSAGLVPVVSSIDGGAIPIGATAQVVVLFRNEGGQPVETGTIRLYPSSTVSTVVSLNQCENEPLPSGAECAIALSVKGLQAGPWRVEMLMAHSGRTRLVTATVSGNVETTEGAGDKLTSDVETIPDEVDFGSLDAAQTLIEPIILRNITSNEIDITDIYIDTSEQAGYNLKTECKKLAAGQSCIATITWSPKLKGRSSGVLVVKHTGPAALSSVPLKGEYAPESVNSAEVFPQAVPGKGLLVSSAEDVDFGSDIETASSITISLVNSGDADLMLRDIRISGSDNGIGFKQDGCLPGTVLEPVEACPLTVTWSPTRVGDILDDIQILHDGARGVLVLPVRGSAMSTVSQDQKAIVLTEDDVAGLIAGPPELSQGAENAGVQESQEAAAERNAARAGSKAVYGLPKVTNVAGVLDGYKITSFSPTRAIINGPGGSRLVFDNEEVVLGGVPWLVVIQANGIEFMHQGKRVLLLFDRSLSSINRVNASSSESGDSASSGDSGGG
ncbi:MAG: choice-of-anchor D domain-containing protein [Rhodospirillales bacterium]|nr:choice-of-anchor D domain-containing protein [Rhodospirillales bacterium]